MATKISPQARGNTISHEASAFAMLASYASLTTSLGITTCDFATQTAPGPTNTHNDLEESVVR
jgi:hypothetical protein